MTVYLDINEKQTKPKKTYNSPNDNGSGNITGNIISFKDFTNYIISIHN